MSNSIESTRVYTYMHAHTCPHIYVHTDQFPRKDRIPIPSTQVNTYPCFVLVLQYLFLKSTRISHKYVYTYIRIDVNVLHACEHYQRRPYISKHIFVLLSTYVIPTTSLMSNNTERPGPLKVCMHTCARLGVVDAVTPHLPA